MVRRDAFDVPVENDMPHLLMNLTADELQDGAG